MNDVLDVTQFPDLWAGWEMSSHPPPPHLTLDNFNIESEVPENCPFVLTSPRSLEACRTAGVQVKDFLSRNNLIPICKYLSFCWVFIPVLFYIRTQVTWSAKSWNPFCIKLSNLAGEVGGQCRSRRVSTCNLKISLNTPWLCLQSSRHSFINYCEYSSPSLFTTPYWWTPISQRSQ